MIVIGYLCVVVALEDVTVPVAPQFLAPVIGKLGAAGFRSGCAAWPSRWRSALGR